MRILVTGAKGFIGKNLVESLNNNLSYEIFAISRDEFDLTQTSSWREIAQDINPNVVFHLAAKTGGLFGNLKNSFDYFSETLLINAALFKSIKFFEKNTKFIIPIAGCGYPEGISNPLSESDLWQGLPHETALAYSMAKKIAHIAACEAKRTNVAKIYTPLLGNVYGPNDHFDSDDAHVIPALFRKFIKAGQNNASISLPGSGVAVRDFIYIEDVVTILTHYIENDYPVLLNVSSGETISIKDLVFAIKYICKIDAAIIWENDGQDGKLDKRFDNTKLKEYYPNFKFTTIREGLAKTWNWLQSQK